MAWLFWKRSGNKTLNAASSQNTSDKYGTNQGVINKLICTGIFREADAAVRKSSDLSGKTVFVEVPWFDLREIYEVTNEMFSNILMELLGIIIIWFGLAFSVLIHETGHMTGYKLAAGKEDWIIQVGFGKTLIITKHFDIRMIPTSGVFYDQTPEKSYTKAQALLCAAGGPVLNLLFILILFALQSNSLIECSAYSAYIDYYGPTWDFLRSYNVIMFLSAIIPMRYPAFFPVIGGMESDGMHILKVLRNKG